MNRVVLLSFKCLKEIEKKGEEGHCSYNCISFVKRNKKIETFSLRNRKVFF